MTIKALFSETTKNPGDVRCTLCPHECYIKEGMSGRCKVRKNRNGILTSLNYFRFSAISLDPIEKKPLYNFYPGSKILSLGSVGCNMSCPFCQNSEIACETVEYNNTFFISKEEIIDRAIISKSSGNIGIAYTYNEPTVWFETVYEISQEASRNNLKNVLVTNGYINANPLEKLLPYIDAVNIDLKTFSETKYKNVLGGDLEYVKKSIEVISSYCHTEITTLIVPGFNDSISEIKKISAFLRETAPECVLHLSRFFPSHRWNDIPPTDTGRMYELAFEAQKILKNVTLGNM